MKKHRVPNSAFALFFIAALVLVFVIHPWKRAAVPLKSADAYAFQSDPVSSPRKNLSGALLRMEDLLRVLLSYSPSIHRPLEPLNPGPLEPYLLVFLNLNDEIVAQGLLTRGEIDDFYRQSQSRHLPHPVLARAEKANSVFNSKFSRLNKRLNSAGQSVANLLNNNVGADRRAARSDVGSRNLQVANKLPFALRWKLNGLLKTVSSWNRGMESDILGSDLPYSSPAYKPQILATGQMVPAYLGGSGGSPIPGDLEGALGAEITPEIQAKVQELNSQPIEIYEYVKDTLGYEPYYGVMKGALETLRQGAGNDADLASLLIAMYRAAGYQARYVRGIARIPVDRLASWMGLSASSSTPSPLVGEGGGEGGITVRVGQVLQAAGIPFTPVYFGGKITGYDVERIWAEVYLPYGEYRGAILNEKAGRMWIPLDPGFKQHTLEGQAVDLLGGMNKTGQSLGEEYLNAATGTTFLQFFQGQASSYLATAHPDLILDDIKVNRVLKPERLRLLPNTLPYPVERVISEYAVLPDELIHQAKVTISATSPSPLRGEGGGEGDILFQRTFKLPELAGKRFTLSYQGATPADEDAIASNGGLMATPPYLVNVTPVLRVNGEPVILSGSEGSLGSIGLGIKHLLRIDFISPSGSKRVESEVIAGNYYGLGVAAQRSSFLDPDSFVQCPASSGECIGQNIPSSSLVPSESGTEEGAGEGEPTPQYNYPATSISGPETDGLGGRLLYQRAVGYLNQLYADEEEISSYLGMRLIRPEASLVIVGNELEVTYLSGIPQLIEWKGVRIDATSRPISPVILSGSEGSSGAAKSNFMLLSGYQSSSLENLVFEKDFGVESVSAVKAIQLAHAQGIDVVTITQDNMDTVLPIVDCSDEVREDIVNKVNQGLRLTVHALPLTYFNWIGTGYVALDPETGNAGYFLSGQIAGGMTVWGIALWSWDWIYDLYSLLSNPDLTVTIEKNPALANGIQKLEGDYQKGKAGKILTVPFKIMVTTGGEYPRPVSGASVAFQVQNGGGSFSGNACVTQVELAGDKRGTILTDFYLGQKTSDNPVYIYEKGKPKATQAGLNIVKVYLRDKPDIYDYFQVLGLPGQPVKVIKLAGDGVGKVLSFSGFVSARVEDQFDNPVSNAGVTFTVLPPSQPPTGFKNALIYKPGDCDKSFPLWGECGEAGPIKDMLTDFQGTAVQTILGNADNFAYTFRAEVPGANSVDFIQYSEKVTDTMVLKVSYSVPFSTLGYPINGVQVGKFMPQPVTATLTLTRKEGDVFTVEPVSDGQVEFIPDPPEDCPIPHNNICAEIYVDGEKTNIAEPKGIGKYIANIKVDEKPGVDWVKIKGTYIDPSTKKGLKDYVYYYVYGVTATITGISPELLWLNREGKGHTNLRVDYKIEPSGYHADVAQVLVYKDGNTIVGASPASVSGTGSLMFLSGAKFEYGKDYRAELALNLGTDVAIKSKRSKIDLAQMLITKVIMPNDGASFTTILASANNRYGENLIGLRADIKPDSLDTQYNNMISWVVDDDPRDGYYSGNPTDPVYGNAVSAIITILPVPKAPNGRGYPLSYQIKAGLNINSTFYSTDVTYITQDRIDQLRQQYVDVRVVDTTTGQLVGAKIIPWRSEFRNAQTYVNPGYFPFSEIKSPDYEWAIFTIAQNLENIRSDISDRIMAVNSGYRTPKYNLTMPDPKVNSPHIYGKAADIANADFNDDGRTDAADQRLMRTTAKARGACVEPFGRTPTWVHLDWRSETCPANW